MSMDNWLLFYWLLRQFGSLSSEIRVLHMFLATKHIFADGETVHIPLSVIRTIVSMPLNSRALRCETMRYDTSDENCRLYTLFPKQV